MNYETKNFDYLLGLFGLSDQLLKNHFTLYQGYVTNVNKILEERKKLIDSDQTSSPVFAELTRRLGWEWNGLRLHELYFENLTQETKKLDPASSLFLEIEQSFGNFENWEKEFRAIGAMRGIGWVILYRDTVTGKLLNVWINEHDVGHLSGAKPIIVLDVFEHAFMLDYGIKRADYLNIFMTHLDWPVIEKR